MLVLDIESVKDVDRSAEIVEDSSSLDSLISELEKSEDIPSASPQTSTPKPPLQKESVLVRLANRIKVRILEVIRALEFHSVLLNTIFGSRR